MRGLRLFRLFGLLGIAFVLTSCSLVGRSRVTQDLSKPATLPPIPLDEQRPPTPPSAARGAAIYEQKCAACHGVGGAGDGSAAAAIRAQGRQVASLVDPARARAAQPGEWLRVIANGRIANLMPGFSGSLNAQDRWDVLTYVWALGANPQMLQTTASGFQSNCVRCHAQPVALMAGVALGKYSITELAGVIARSPTHLRTAGLGVLGDTQRQQLAEYLRASVFDFADASTLRSNTQRGDGRLAYVAQNGTRPGAPLGDAAVTLRAYDSRSEVFSRTARLNASGLAVFDDLPRRADVFYEPEITYGGARFFGAPAQLTATLALTQPLRVFDVTSDAGAISISEWHSFVQGFGEGTISMAELFVFDNASDKAFTGADGRSVKISLPPDATNVRFEGAGLGARFVRDGDLVGDLDAVLPGVRASQISLSYDMPYRNAKSLARELFYAVKSWDVIVPDGELRVTGIPDRGVQNLPSVGAVRLYVQTQPSSIGVFRYGLAGQPRAASGAGNDTRSLLIAFFALAGALMSVVVLLSRARSDQRGRITDDGFRETLVRQIADLDDAFARAEIDEAYHRETRARLKARLRAVWA